jgi:hypothetical protein
VRAGQGNTAFLDPPSRHEPGLANLVNHKLDFEDAAVLGGSSTAGSTRTPIDACTARSRVASGKDHATDEWLQAKRLAIASAISSGASSWM